MASTTNLAVQVAQLRALYPEIDEAVAEDMVASVGFEDSVRFLRSQEEPTLYAPIYEPLILPNNNTAVNPLDGEVAEPSQTIGASLATLQTTLDVHESAWHAASASASAPAEGDKDYETGDLYTSTELDVGLGSLGSGDLLSQMQAALTQKLEPMVAEKKQKDAEEKLRLEAEQKKLQQRLERKKMKAWDLVKTATTNMGPYIGSLPHDVALQIAQLLSAFALGRFQCVAKSCVLYCGHRQFWIPLYRDDWTVSAMSPEKQVSGSWKANYVKVYMDSLAGIIFDPVGLEHFRWTSRMLTSANTTWMVQSEDDFATAVVTRMRPYSIPPKRFSWRDNVLRPIGVSGMAIGSAWTFNPETDEISCAAPTNRTVIKKVVNPRVPMQATLRLQYSTLGYSSKIGLRHHSGRQWQGPPATKSPHHALTQLNRFVG